MARALIFPGQGSQTVGMGQALAADFPIARAVFEEVDEALGRRLTSVMWEGPVEALNLTTNTQPALMAHSVAAARVLKSECGIDVAECAFVAGHSLGEYSALCVAGAMSLAQAARLLQVRGEAMLEASPAGVGAMVALLGVSIEQAEEAIASTPGDGVLEIANDNAPGQVVLSGGRARVEALASNARALGIKMAKLLPVSGAFHSSLMAPAAATMANELAVASIDSPAAPLVANVTAQPTGDPDEIKDLLVRQVTGRVRWTESVTYMAAHGARDFVEIGPGRILAGMVRRIAKDATVSCVGEPNDIAAFHANA
ncbi:MAG: ACP S-malonyltransferase [Alphaproteobacteria bacterium]|nr:ACP S-malonyltransferase [Alphaproteobacteria bacterium]